MMFGVRESAGRVICAGSCVIDRKLHLESSVVMATSNPARATTSFGGVARNVAETLARLETPTVLVSRVGDDDSGRAITAHLTSLGVDVSAMSVAFAAETAQYVALLDPAGELVVAASAIDVLDGLAPSDLDAVWPGEDPADPLTPRAPGWLFADCNLPIDTLTHAIRRAERDDTPLVIDAVSTHKVVKLPRDLNGVRVLFCNVDEAQALADYHGWNFSGNTLDLSQLLHERGARHVVVTRGGAGAVLADADGTRLIPATAAAVHDVTGAGDAMIAGALTLLVTGASIDDAVLAGTLVGALTVESQYSVRPDLSPDLVDSAALHRLRRPGMIAASRARAEDALGLEGTS